MKKYNFGQQKKVFVIGPGNGELKNYCRRIENNLFVKDEDEIKPSKIQKLIEDKINLMGRYRGQDLRPSIKQNKSSKKWQENEYGNSVIICIGDAGIGSINDESMMKIFDRLNKILEYNDSHLFFIRGSYDDPSYFDGEKINLSNITAIPDYTTLEIKNNVILCIGGGIAIDREWRKAQEERIGKVAINGNKKTFFGNTCPILSFDELKSLPSSLQNKKLFILSNTSPSFIRQIGKKEEFTKEDSSLSFDILQAKLTIDKIYIELLSNGITPKHWLFSKRGVDYQDKINDIVFKSVKQLEAINLFRYAHDASDAFEMITDFKYDYNKWLKTSLKDTTIQPFNIGERRIEPFNANELFGAGAAPRQQINENMAMDLEGGIADDDGVNEEEAMIEVDAPIMGHEVPDFGLNGRAAEVDVAENNVHDAPDAAQGVAVENIAARLADYDGIYRVNMFDTAIARNRNRHN